MFTAIIVACVFSGNVLAAPCTMTTDSHEGSTAVCVMIMDIGSREDLAKHPEVMLRYTCSASGDETREGYFESPLSARATAQSEWRKGLVAEALAHERGREAQRNLLLAEAAMYKLASDAFQDAADQTALMATPRGDKRESLRAQQKVMRQFRNSGLQPR